MIYIETGTEDVYQNFALEYYFAAEHPLPDTVFLFWRTTPTLMVGKYQNTLEEINKPYADEHGIHVVRRMSGGGTIYTDLGGWQYTFIQRSSANEISFREFITPVVDALAEVGVTAEWSGRNDLLIDGRKFSGTAQYRIGDSVVHHGSLLFSSDIEQMVVSTTVDEFKILSKSIKSVRDRVTNIADHLPTPMNAETFKEIMVRHIMQGSDKTYVPTEADEVRIAEIRRERFDNWERIYGASPRFNIERTGRLAGGKMQFRLLVEKGLIRSASVNGDFFATVDSSVITDALLGCRYDQEAVLNSLRAHHIDGAVFQISAEDMAKTIAD